MDGNWRELMRSARELERVVPISERREVEGEFAISLASMEVYGEAGCVIRYALDLFRPDFSDLEMTGPVSGQTIQFSDLDPEFAVRDQSGYVYDSVFDGGSTSTHIDNAEFRYAYFSIQPLRPETEELTVDLVRLVRETRYNDASPERPAAPEAEEVADTVWTGPLSFTFAVRGLSL